MCLKTKECNATDTASLLIALLRVSGIPSRYATGTIEIPIENFKNWVGDFQDAQAALDYVSSGGVPVAGLLSGGQIVAVRMEHVWVEGWIDFVPSRGARHIEGDTWVSMETVLKPTRFQAPLDVQSTLGIDPQDLLGPVLATAVQSPDGYSVTGLSSTDLNTALQSVFNQLKTHVTTNMPNSTVGELTGALAIQQETRSVLPTGLPGKVIARGGQAPTLPTEMFSKISLRVMDRFGIGPEVSLTWTTPELAGKRVTIGYVPATAADATTVAAYGGLYQTPAYLINVRPVVYVEGVVVGSGGPMSMGETQRVRVEFQEPDGRTDQVEHLVTTGGYNALGLELQRIPSETALDRKNRLTAAIDKLGIIDVNGDDIIGEMMHLHGLTYFMQTEAANMVLSNGMNVANLKRPAELLVSFKPVFSSIFGLPHSVINAGIEIDVARFLQSPVSRTGDMQKELNYMKISGANASAAEHGVFELLQNVQAVSAVKLIAEANNRGIPVFHIDSTNIGQILPQLQVSPDVLADVQNAVAAGKQVTIPRENIPLLSWDGVGYIVLDPVTGAGAYLISGGLAGGGTAERKLNDFVSVLEVWSDIVNYINDIAYIAKGVAQIFKAALKNIGFLFSVISGLIKAYDVLDSGGTLSEAVLSGVGDFLISFSIGFFAMTLGTFASSILFTVFIVSAATLATMWLKNLVFTGYIWGAVYRQKRKSMMAKNFLIIT